MSGPDVIDERFDDLGRELRSGEVTASPGLRERVRAIVEREPEPPLAAGQLRARWRRAGRRRRIGLALVPVAGIVAAAVGVGVFTSGSTHSWQAAQLSLDSVQQKRAQVGSGHARGGIPASPMQPTLHAHGGTFTDKPPNPTALSSATLPPSGSRAQIYAVDVHPRADDLSPTT